MGDSPLAIQFLSSFIHNKEAKARDCLDQFGSEVLWLPIF